MEFFLTGSCDDVSSAHGVVGVMGRTAIVLAVATPATVLTVWHG
jgi:hypothetical protein